MTELLYKPVIGWFVKSPEAIRGKSAENEESATTLFLQHLIILYALVTECLWIHTMCSGLAHFTKSKEEKQKIYDNTKRKYDTEEKAFGNGERCT